MFHYATSIISSFYKLQTIYLVVFLKASVLPNQILVRRMAFVVTVIASILVLWLSLTLMNHCDRITLGTHQLLQMYKQQYF